MASSPKNQNAAPPAGDTPPGLRMKELMEATGLPKSTLLYYVDQGLLPPPVKTSPNMAYYDPVCVERAALIKDLQANYRLPLQKIRGLLDMASQGLDIGPMVQLTTVIFGERDEGLLDLDGFCQATGLRPDRVAELQELGAIMPLEPGRYDSQDVAAGQALSHGAARGLKPADVEFYPRLAREIVEHEMRLRARVTADMPELEDATVTMQMVMDARTLRAYVINRVFQHRVAALRGLKDDES